MEEQFNREGKEGWRARSEDRKHTSGGVLVAVDSNLGAEKGATDSIR